MEFRKFQKIPRLSRDMVITEKIDGTNAIIGIDEDMDIHAGSRNRWLTLDNDNYGFCKWVFEHSDDLLKLGPGMHYGEWWGQGIQRRYGLEEKRFSLFNVNQWTDSGEEGKEQVPECCHVVPILYTGMFSTEAIQNVLNKLSKDGSCAAPGFVKPEGIVIFHTAGGCLFKKTIDNDGGKG